MKNKIQKLKKSGVTLTELIIAMAILAVVTAPIIGMFMYSTRLTAASYKLTMSSVIAQMKMEELIGEETLENVPRTPEGNFWYEISVQPTDFKNLWNVTVNVYESQTGGSPLQSFTNIINTAEGGFYTD